MLVLALFVGLAIQNHGTNSTLEKENAGLKKENAALEKENVKLHKDRLVSSVQNNYVAACRGSQVVIELRDETRCV